MAGPLQGPAADRTPYGTGRNSAAGGKIRPARHHLNLQQQEQQRSALGTAENRDTEIVTKAVGGTTAGRRGPYDRPATGRHASAGPQAAARKSAGTAWIGVGSRILSGASSFLSSFFRKDGRQNLALPPPQSLSGEDKPFEEMRDDGIVFADSEIVEDVEIEGLLKERVFTREQCDRFMRVLQTKLNNDKVQPQKFSISNGLIEDRDQRYPDDELERERERDRERRGPRVDRPVEEAVIDGDIGSSPVDIAKAYMGKRLSPVSTSAFPVRTLDYAAMSTRDDYRVSPSRIATPGHTPYVRLRPLKTYDDVRPTPYPVRSSAAREKKRRVEDDFDYSGRRTRLKMTTTNAPPLSTLPSASNELGNGSYFDRMRNLQRRRVDKANKEEDVTHVPTQSSETARRILETLEILTPPKVKTLEEELSIVRERRPKDISPSHMSEQARKTMQEVECPIVEIATDPSPAGGQASSSKATAAFPIQPTSTDLKGKGVTTSSDDGPSVLASSTPPFLKGFRMTAAMEESNSDDEGQPSLSNAEAVKVPVFDQNALKVKSDGVFKSGFTFPSTHALSEPPTPKPIPSPTLKTGSNLALADTFSRPQGATENKPVGTDPKQLTVDYFTSEKYKPTSAPNVSQQPGSSNFPTKPVDIPCAPASNGIEDGTKVVTSTSNGSPVLVPSLISPSKPIFDIAKPAATQSTPDSVKKDEKSSELVPSIFGIMKPPTTQNDGTFGSANGSFHLKPSAAEEATKGGLGGPISAGSTLSSFSSAATSTSSSIFSLGTNNSSDLANGSSTEAKDTRDSSSLFGAIGTGPAFLSSSAAPFSTLFGSSSSASTTGSKPVFTFGSTGSAGGSESQPAFTFGAASDSSEANAVSDSKPAFAFGSSNASPAENKPASTIESKPFQFPSPVSESKPPFQFGASSAPATSAAFGFTSSSAPSMFTSSFGASSSSATGSTAFAASTSQSVSPFSSGSAQFSFSASSSASGAPFTFGATTSFSTSSFSFGASSSTSSSTATAGTTSSFTFGSNNSFPAFNATSTVTGDMEHNMEDSMAEEPVQPSISQPPALFGSTPSQPFVFGGTQTSAGAGFGAQPTTSAPAFGTQSGPTFGAQSTPAFVAQSTPAFVAQSAPAFGAQSAPAFGAQTAPAFGAQTAPAFVAQTAPAFGQTAPAFGSQGTPAFGVQPFGSQPSPLFGVQAPSFGAQAAQGSQPAPFSGFSGFSMGAEGGGEQRTRKYIKAKRTGGSKRGK